MEKIIAHHLTNIRFERNNYQTTKIKFYINSRLRTYFKILYSTCRQLINQIKITIAKHLI